MVDRDDIRTVYFRDPATHAWHRLEWEHAAQIDAPFSADAAAYVRAIGARTHRHVDPQQAVQDLLADWTAGEVATRRDRNLAIRLSAQRAAAGGDTATATEERETAPVPGVVDGLPASHANRIGGLLRGSDHWPDVLASLERLMTLLQQHPPPIDYQARRAHASKVDAFTEAIDAARRIHPSRRPNSVLVRQLWERFTGGDIAYTPDSLRLDPASPAYAEFRRQLAVRDAALFHLAHRQLQRSLQETGPATWTPSATVESEWPDVTAHLGNCSHPGWD
jgi:hypothetical protein